MKELLSYSDIQIKFTKRLMFLNKEHGYLPHQDFIFYKA